MSRRDGVLRSYRAAFLRFLARHEESALHAGYEIGRSALQAGLGLLELVRVHHDVLIEVLAGTPAEEGPAVAAAASDFFLEVLSSYEMVQRGLRRDG
ncbi:phosphatase RsbU N-terminal domain-containing protein [Modestobacter marinus]|uniref:phosphatase RsbU N-terminal domain-containing protein n=1 Tax=Modestobacter marinus TaxID=477641 RepID=UPI001C982A26|nr:phosphatase RsbU N-terminal domain-containing protein [Modestobacter marinus]